MRISREQLFMEAAKLSAKRSSCLKMEVGAVLVKDNRIICMGYNGVLPGKDPRTGLDEDGNTHTVHAETNIIAFCAKEGIPTKGTDMYITLSPCEKCAEILVQAGVNNVYYLEKYRDPMGIHILTRNQVRCHQYTE